ncbi:MAG: hypothetical protein MUF38_16330 [Anaerolineae bacterium]|nr:hypothetical protein [Anaerolineae bacterium]
MSISTRPSVGLQGHKRTALVLMVAGALYLLTRPWVWLDSAALSLSAFDFAEWLTIVPAVRFGEDAMQTPFYLRLLPALLLFALTLLSGRRFSLGWWLTVPAVGLMVIGLLPPPEYFLDPALRPDSNYEQLVMVAAIALGLSVVGLSGVLLRFQRVLLPVIFAVCAVLAWFAVQRGGGYINTYLPASANALPFITWTVLGAVIAFFWPENKPDA